MNSPVSHCRQCGAVLDGPPPVRKCGQCGTTNFDGPVAAVLVLVRDDAGRILMTRQPWWPADWWGLVAGFVEEGETAEQAVLREVKEETGLDVEIERFLGTFTRPHMKGRLMIAYSARMLGGKLQAGDDVCEARWVDSASALAPPDSIAADAIVQFLDDWQRRLEPDRK